MQSRNSILFCLCVCICLPRVRFHPGILSISVFMLLRKLFCFFFAFFVSNHQFYVSFYPAVLCLLYCLSDHVISIYGFGVFAIFSNILLNHLKKNSTITKKITCVSKYAHYFVFHIFIVWHWWWIFTSKFVRFMSSLWWKREKISLLNETILMN